jgi:hypothetical protein
MSHKATIDLVTYDLKRDAHILVAVEQGDGSADSLRRLQERLYDYVDIAVDGVLAQKYPESRGKSVVIRLDCYDTPRDACEQFFSRFAKHIHSSREVQAAIAEHGHTVSLDSQDRMSYDHDA